VVPTRFAIMDVYSGEELHHVRFGSDLEQRFGTPYIVLHRHDLLTALMEAALATGLVTAHTAKTAVGVDQDADSAWVECADGSRHRADLVVGADGIRSSVRRAILDDSEPQTSEYVIYRGPGPRPEGVENAVKLYTGDGMHLMQYPIAGGELLNRVLSFKSTAGEPGSDEWGTPEELHDRFAAACPYIRDSLSTLDLTKKWVQFDRPPLAGWTQGRVTLLGDAAHAMRQYLAQGAGQALEDGVGLAACLQDHDDVATALAAYEATRYPRTSAVQMNTRFFGEFTHMGGLEAIVRNHLLASLPNDNYDIAEWLYGDGSVPPPVPPAHLQLY
jgi:3-hydroxybenzoate 6-monooxygenase